MLLNQIDELFSAIVQRPTERSSGPEPEPEPSLDVGHGLGVDFKIAIVGDSTMRVRVRSHPERKCYGSGSGF